MKDWNPKGYLTFSSARTQPAVDLASRILHTGPKKALDVGCGPGNSTAVLKARFPGCEILGIDSSANMIDAAKAQHPQCAFALCDAGRELHTLGQTFDVVFSNACIQWIPDHPNLLKNMVSLLNPGGVLAVQTPMNDEEPAQLIIARVANSPRWKGCFQETSFFHNLTPEAYYNLLCGLAAQVTMWHTIYYHVMDSHQAIADWYRTTAMKPYLDVLSQNEQEAFEAEILEQLQQAYPVQENGKILFCFRRFFFLAAI